MDNRVISFFDRNNTKEECQFFHTDIMIYIEGTNELVFRGSNKLILPGSAFTARCHFNLTGSEITPSYNTALGLENSVTENPSTTPRVFLFAVGTDGCGIENSQVYPVDYKKWIGLDALIPFRYVLPSSDLNSTLREKYFGRKVITADGNSMVAYYFKAFESAPILVQQFVDGTPIDSSIYSSARTDNVETYVELKLKVTKDDCREYFINTTGINDARINTISLLTAWPKVINGLTYYQDIRPLTKLNFSNESLIDVTKGLDIIYHIYY